MEPAFRRARARLRPATALVGLVVALAAAVPALAQFPGRDPSESPRLNTPNDPEFDWCETDDRDTPAVRECASYWSEQYEAFGFGPDSSTAVYQDATQLDAQGRDANTKAGRAPLAQIGGVRADTAWKYSVGIPEVVVAVLDTGIEWQNRELIEKVRLNTAELPRPPGAASHDANGDGRVTVGDWATDLRVSPAAGDEEADDVLDASDLIATFSDGFDDDANAYVDDIAGWDFFDDDNDPFDASSCCSATGHGTARMLEAARATNDGRGRAGICPECQIMPLRVWDTFILPTDLFALGTVYAADNDASVVEGAVGGLTNTSFARRAFTYADRKGVTLTLVSSDINSANHNYPTNYNEAIYVGGALPDTAPGENCEAPGIPGGFGGGDESPQCKAFLAAIDRASGGRIRPSSQPPTTSFFRNANLTQYGGKADIVMMGSTGSANTGQASGAAGLIQSFARQRFAAQSEFPKTLSGNEVRQVLTMSAEDVRPGNTGQIGSPDKAQVGWDPHFGYGRVNLAGAMAMVQAGRIPPEAQLDTPDWFAPINVDKLGDEGVPIKGRVAAPHSAAGVGEWTIEWACGQDAPDSSFVRLEGATGTGAQQGILGTLTKQFLTQRADTCDGSIANDAGLPAGRPSDPWPQDPYPDPDPHRHAVQIRLTARDAADPANIGRYRKTIFPYRDDGVLPGWPKPIGRESLSSDLVTGSGGEVPPRLADLDGDNLLDVVLGTSSGELHVLQADGTPLPSWNEGRPVMTDLVPVAAAHPPPRTAGPPPRESLRAPAIGDVTGDGDPEVVATAGEHLYVWDRQGRPVPGFPQRVDPTLSEPCIPDIPRPCFAKAERFITRENHIKRGFIGAPALADLDEDGRLDVVAGALDQHVYAWNGEGRLLPGFPVKLSSPTAEAGAEIVTSPAIADLDGDRDPEVVIATNESLRTEQRPPSDPDDLASIFVGAVTGFAVTYAIHGDGKPVAGWPVKLGSLVADILPLVGPGHDAAVLDVDGDGNDEVSLSALTAEAKLVDGNGSVIRSYNHGGTTGDNTDPSRQFNVYDYASVGDIVGMGRPAVVKNGLSLNGGLNLLATNQNFPFNHTVQAWDPGTGSYLPGFPVPTDDYQLLAHPAIAKVDASGTGRQALVGTGLYQLHAYGLAGDEPAGWPKFAGGWLQPTPSVGDVDGDGKLDVVAVTREGWSFVWRTAAPACAAGATSTNAEWWTFHHDEHSTANYGHDGRPPSRPGPIDRGPGGGDHVALTFAASGDDHLCGKATSYEAAGSDIPIESGADFERGANLRVAIAADRAAAGAPQTLVVLGGARFRYVAVRGVDDVGNVSLVRSAEGKPLPPDDAGEGGSGAPPPPGPPGGSPGTGSPAGSGGSGAGSGGPGGQSGGPGPGPGAGTRGTSPRRRIACLPRRLRVGSRGIGRIRLGQRRGAVVRRAGAPSKAQRRALRYCVRGGGRVLVALSRRGRVSLVLTTARGHRARGVRRGSSARTMRRAYPRTYRLGLRVRADRRTRRVLGVRRGRVTFVGVADRRAVRHRRLLAYYLRRAGVRR